MTPEKDPITEKQRKFWKGVLLPALAKDTGETVDYFENLLKVSVMPDEFATKHFTVNRNVYFYIPSIATLSMQQMNTLIEGAVAKCHEWGFMWVSLPSRELRK